MRYLTTRLILGLLLCTQLPVSVFADEVNQAVTESWVKQLIAGTRSERVAAQRELLTAGPGVLEWLPPLDSIHDIAAREQLRRIRIELERRSAKESVQASLLTLSAEMTLADAFRAVREQSKNRFAWKALPADVLSQSIATDINSVPFWQVMTTLADRFEFHWQRPESGSELQLVDGMRQHIAKTQVLESVLLSVEPIKTRPIGTDNLTRLVRVRCRLEVEPRLRPLFLAMTGRDVVLKDSTGKELPAFNPDAQYELALGDAGEVAFDVDFLATDAEIDVHDCLFQGQLTLTIAAGTEEIRFRDLSKSQGASRRRGGVTVTLRDVTTAKFQDTPLWKTRLAVAYETGGPAFESHRTWIFHNQAYLEGPNGVRQKRDAGFSTELTTDGGVILEYSFHDPPFEIARTDFVYVAPTLITTLPIEFRMPKVPGPPSKDTPQTESHD